MVGGLVVWGERKQAKAGEMINDIQTEKAGTQGKHGLRA